MIIKYDIEIDKEAIISNIERISNRIFKLLPEREEGKNWQVPLKNLIIETGGMSSLLSDHVDLFRLLSNMESLLFLDKDDDFVDFRKCIFECLNDIKRIKDCL